MNLMDALQETGCAIFVNGECVTSVEWLSDTECLLMTRRGVCILQCLLLPLQEILKRYERTQWQPARVSLITVQTERQHT